MADTPLSCHYTGEVTATYARHRGVHSGVLGALIRHGIRRSESGDVLDVGCGTANYLRALSDVTSWQGWGLDPSLEMLKQADGSLSGRLALRVQSGHAGRLPFAAAGFDLVYSVDVVHHIADLDAAFRELQRVLKPGGRSITATDSEATIRARVPLSSYFPATISPELARYPGVARLETLHARHGLEIIAAFVVEMSYVLEDATPFRRRAFSCLHLISDDELRAGLLRLEHDLPLDCVSRNYVIVAENGSGSRG